MTGSVVASMDGPVGVIELARPEKFNCLSQAAWLKIDQARAACEADGAIRAILTTRKATLLHRRRPPRSQNQHVGQGALEAFMLRGIATLDRLEASPLPVVAAVQGLCLAGGTELMLSADVVFAARTARIGDQHAQWGLVPAGAAVSAWRA